MMPEKLLKFPLEQFTSEGPFAGGRKMCRKHVLHDVVGNPRASQSGSHELLASRRTTEHGVEERSRKRPIVQETVRNKLLEDLLDVRLRKPLPEKPGPRLGNGPRAHREETRKHVPWIVAKSAPRPLTPWWLARTL